MGYGDSRRRSAASTSVACARTPCAMRPVKKPTAVSDSTATHKASSNTESSPDFRSRHRLRRAKRKISTRPAHRAARVEFQDSTAAARQLSIVSHQNQGAAGTAVELEQQVRDALAG